MKTATAVGEGPVDIEVCRRLSREVGVTLSATYVMGGVGQLDRKLGAYNHAAKRSRWLVLRDLDSAECAAGLRLHLLPDPAHGMRFRIAVREVEAWLLADQQRFSTFLQVAPSRLPSSPDDVPDPKQAVVNLARHSRSPRIRDGLVPREGGHRPVGPGYTTLISEFVLDLWRPAVAQRSSPSLRRCLTALQIW